MINKVEVTSEIFPFITTYTIELKFLLKDSNIYIRIEIYTCYIIFHVV